MVRVTVFSRAGILAVGSELLTPSRIDTNSLFITEQLNLLGIEVAFKTIVGDDREELANAVRMGLGRVDLIVCSGGLGPTDDDVTREVVADVAAAEPDRGVVLDLSRHQDHALLLGPRQGRRAACEVVLGQSPRNDRGA